MQPARQREAKKDTKLPTAQKTLTIALLIPPIKILILRMYGAYFQKGASERTPREMPKLAKGF